MKMSLFDYSAPSLHEVLVWSVNEHGFVEVEKINLEL
jgi:hypothetical protein